MKRFTDTDKWRDPWFRKLSAGAKLAFLFIVDNCDNAGVWDADMELANFSIGMEIPWEKVRESLGERLEVLKSGKWHLKKFVNFQCGELSEECKPHAAVIRLLNKHGIQRASKEYPKGIHTLKEKDQDKDKERDKEQEGDARGQESADEEARQVREEMDAHRAAIRADAKLLLEALNELTGKKFTPVDSHLNPIIARLNETGIEPEECEKMLRRQVKLWKNDPKMSAHLVPSTLFRASNFQKYYDQRDEGVANGQSPLEAFYRQPVPGFTPLARPFDTQGGKRLMQ
jgi:uncharacterized phage protein (TIGR02220 family)